VPTSNSSTVSGMERSGWVGVRGGWACCRGSGADVKLTDGVERSGRHRLQRRRRRGGTVQALMQEDRGRRFDRMEKNQ
jgi:hypothetical protein